MKINRQRHAQQGFTAIEMMIAMLIGLMISAAAVAVFASSTTMFRVSGSVAQMQESGRTALQMLERDVRMAGFRGCNSNNVANSAPLTNTISSPANYSNDLGNFLRGNNSTGVAWNPALATAYASIAADSDVLVLRLPAGNTIPLTATMANSSAALQLASVAGIAVGTPMIVADCAGSAAFKVTAIVGNTISHAAGGTNASGNLLRAYGDDAVAMVYQTRAYFVGTSSSGVAGARSLWLRNDTAAPVEVADNIDRLEVLYGEDLNSDYVADVFRNANQVVNFANVMAVQVHVLARGQRNNEALAPTPYSFMGAVVTPNDRFLRRVYSATIQLRNRVL